MMQWTRVDSSWISAVRLVPSGIEVKLLDGRSYLYHGAGERLYNELLRASSKGAFVTAHLKKRYPVTETY